MENQARFSFVDDFNYRQISPHTYTIDEDSGASDVTIMEGTEGDPAYNGTLQVLAGRLLNEYASITTEPSHQFRRDNYVVFFARFRVTQIYNFQGLLGLFFQWGATADWVGLELNTAIDPHFSFASSVGGVETRNDLGWNDTSWHLLEIRFDGAAGTATLVIDDQEVSKSTLADVALPDLKMCLMAYVECLSNVSASARRGWQIDYWGVEQTHYEAGH